MSILLSKPAQETLQRTEVREQLPLQQLLSRLESLNATNLESNSSIRRVTGATEEIYVMRISSNFRAFITKKDKDIVLLSIEKG